MTPHHQADDALPMIESAARVVRDYLTSLAAGEHVAMLKRFPRGCCKGASLLLCRYLVDHHGLRDLRGIANGERQRGKDFQSHFWLEYGDWIIDIAADQFEKDQPRPAPIILTRDRGWHDQFKGQTAFPATGLIEFAEHYEDEYRAMLAWLAS